MTVEQLIDILEDCDPNAIVCDFEGDEIINVDDLGDTIELLS
jgi:hypothetical protein